MMKKEFGKHSEGEYRENRGEESAPSDEECKVFFEFAYISQNTEVLNSRLYD